MKKCPNCGNEYDNDRFYCLNCGMSLVGSPSRSVTHQTKLKAPLEKKPVESQNSTFFGESSKLELSSSSNISINVETSESAIMESVAMVGKNSNEKKKSLIVLLIGAGVMVTVFAVLFGVIISKNGNDRYDKLESSFQYYQESNNILNNSYGNSYEEQSSMVYSESELDNELESVTKPTELVEESNPEIVVATQKTIKKTFLICEGALTWNEAEKKCEEMGGHLAYITSWKEYDNIVSNLDSMELRYAWVGAKTFISGNSVSAKWSDGSKMDFVYGEELWYPGEPSGCDNTSSEKTAEPYVMLCKVNGEWSFSDSNDECLKLFKKEYFCYICEMNGDSATYVSTEVKQLETNSVQQTVLIGKVTTKDDDLNVRISPDISAKRIGTVAKGSTVTITGAEGDWYKIDFNGGVGYVSKSYVDLLDQSNVN